MRLEQLQAFLAVAETGSFQLAAQKCGVTQSTISRQIQTLESELGSSLLHRSVQAKLTVAGELFIAHARRICREWQDATDELTDLTSGKQVELCVAAIQSVCAHHLPPVLQQFCQEYPQIQLRVTSLGSDRALKVLRDGMVDVAIVMRNRWLATSPEMAFEPLYDEAVEVLLAANHPLARYACVPWQELAHYPHVVFKDGYGMQRLVQEQFQQQGIEFRAALELNTLDAFCGVVRQGEFVALLPHTATLAATVDSGLVVRPTAAPHIERQVVLVTTRDRLNLPPIRYFRQLVRQGRDSGTFPPKLNRSNSNNTGPLSFGDRLETPTAAPA